MQDVLQEAMDLEGLREVLRQIENGGIRTIAVDTPVPSVFAHELVNANPYAFLDEAGLEERRARAVSLRGAIPPSVVERAGGLDPKAIETVREQCWPDLVNEHELHDLLFHLVAFPISQLREQSAQAWTLWYQELRHAGRASTVMCAGSPAWVATERLTMANAIWSASDTGSTESAIETAVDKVVRGWLQILGPVTANRLADLVAINAARIHQAFLGMEAQGLLLRGSFAGPAPTDEYEVEWCERRILKRIHDLTRSRLRKQVEAVSPDVFMRWLLSWQHLTPQSRLSGEQGLFQALLQLEGFEAPAIEWERSILPARVADYHPRWLDQLCLSGTLGWGRISPHPAWSVGAGAAPTRVIPSNSTPITFYFRDSSDLITYILAQQGVEESKLQLALSEAALGVRGYLEQRGACFSEDIERALSLTRSGALEALWELAAAGLAAADGFDQLRAMIDPVRKSAMRNGDRKLRSTSGRWSLFDREIQNRSDEIGKARHADLALEAAAHTLLARYGVVFRDLLLRESNLPKWRDLVRMFRRLEDRGVVRGGRFVSGFSGEQFASPEALESLRTAKNAVSEDVIEVAGGDPMNLVGIVVPGTRVAGTPGRSIQFRNGLILGEQEPVAVPRSEQKGQAHAPARPLQFEHRPARRKADINTSLPLFEGLEIGTN
jgi:ATP-dependent Lhr-like helicase